LVPRLSAKRAEIILEAVRLMRDRVEDMAIAMTLEQGKPIRDSVSRAGTLPLQGHATPDRCACRRRVSLWRTRSTIALPTRLLRKPTTGRNGKWAEYPMA
jgi:hypothetical protein